MKQISFEEEARQLTNIKKFDEWYGGFGCEGHRPEGFETELEAKKVQKEVESQMLSVRGLICVKVTIEDRYGNGRLWVHNTTSYDDNAPSVFARL